MAKTSQLVYDLYQLTMAQAYFTTGRHDIEAVFSLTIRDNPFNSGFTVFSGLEPLIEKLVEAKFGKEELDYLSSILSPAGNRVFSAEFLTFLSKFELALDLWSVAEGEVVHPNTPLLKVIGPIWQCQLFESLIINSINYSSAVSTRACRMVMAAKGEECLEFGLRRAPGVEASITASRAAYIGGCSATSNVNAGMNYGIPLKGTVGHSWIISYDTEVEAFEDYMKIYPDNLIFLVDSYDTLNGIKTAIEVASKLPNPNKQLLGIRLDSGDLAYLSIKARQMLDAAGLTNVKIIASNNLDEYIVDSLHTQDAKITVWSFGTKLVANSGTEEMSCVYKLTAMKKAGKQWRDIIKISNDISKVSTPGNLQTKRFFNRLGVMIADVVYSVDDKVTEWEFCPSSDQFREIKIPGELNSKDLMQLYIKEGKVVADLPSLDSIKLHLKSSLKTLDRSIKRLINPHYYPVGLEKTLNKRKVDLVRSKKSFNLYPSI